MLFTLFVSFTVPVMHQHTWANRRVSTLVPKRRPSPLIMASRCGIGSHGPRLLDLLLQAPVVDRGEWRTHKCCAPVHASCVFSHVRTGGTPN